MVSNLYPTRAALVGAITLLLAASAQAQPTISATTPSANKNGAPRAGAVTVRFSQPLTAASTAALRVFSNQRGGLRSGNSGAVSVANNELAFSPNFDFRPGETVRVSVTMAAQSSSGILAAARMFQFTAAATGGNGAFGGGSDVSAGINPYNVMMADVDNDTDLDMISPTFGGSSVSIRLNNGRGIFSGGSDPGVGSQPRSVTMADIDGDGDLDLLTANYNANSASVRFNNGSGFFSGGTDYAAGSQPQSVTTADIDGDGDLDMLVANGNSNNVSLYFNGGTGVFSTGITVAVGSFPFHIATGDVDNDGDLDLLTANWGINSSTISVRLNNGNGVFSGGTDPVMASQPRWLALGDLDNDGDLDLLSANYGSNNASVRFNNGNGVFSGGTELVAGTSPSSIVAADIDGDNDLDMLVSNFYSDNVTIRLNNGNGTFGASSTLTVGSNPNGITTADVDGDGDLDLLAANFSSSTVSVRLNNGTSAPLAVAAASVAHAVAVYPNPAHSSFMVQVPGMAAGTIALANSLGQRVRTDIPLSAGGTAVDISGLAPGIYTMQIQAGNTVLVKPIVVE